MKKYFYAFCFVLAISQVFSQSSWASFVMSNTACVGNTLSVVANTGTNVAIGYTWTALPSSSIISTPNNSITVLTFTPAGTYTIMLAADDGSTIATDSKTISVGPTIITASITGPMCPPPTAIGGLWLVASGASTYTWMPGSYTGGTVGIMQPSVSTTYTVYATDTNGCNDYATQYVQIYPILSIYVSGPTVVCDGTYNCFTATEGFGFGMNVMWSWQDACGNFISGNSTVCLTASMSCSGVYTVTANDMLTSSGCLYQETYSVTVSLCTNINKLEISNNSFELFPNPNINTLNVKSFSTEKSNTQLEISDISCRTISKSKCNFNSEGVYTIDVSEFSPGIYFARIISENKISQPIKIIKE